LLLPLNLKNSSNTNSLIIFIKGIHKINIFVTVFLEAFLAARQIPICVVL